MEAQLYRLLQRLIVKNNINLNKEELKLQLLSHPSYPSLHSVTGVLEHFGVPNAALKLPTNQEVLDQIPDVFLAEIDAISGKEVVLVEKKKNRLKISFQSKKSKTLLQEEFLTQWTGITVVIENDNTITETVPSATFKIAKLTFLILLIGLVSYVMYASPNIFSGAHFLLSIVGVVISIYIVRHELGLQSPKANSICNLTENTSCDDVLNSKGATLFGLFKLSDVSIIAFACCCLSWILFAVSDASGLAVMSLVTAFALPFTFYSIFYQFKVVKKWCPLCLGIIGVLLLQFGALFTSSSEVFPIAIDSRSILIFVSCLLMTAAIWTFLKPLLKHSNELEKLEVDHIKFKRNFKLFDTLLNGSERVSNIGTIPGELVFGNENAPLKIVLVTSPFCGFCKKAHSDIDKLLSVAGKNLSVTIRFNSRSLDNDDSVYRIASQLLYTYQTKGKAATLLALKETFSETVDLQNWMEQHDVKDSETSRFILQQQQEWCSANGINFTPAVYLNDKSYPSEYDRTDLQYFIDDLVDKYSVTVTSQTRSA